MVAEKAEKKVGDSVGSLAATMAAYWVGQRVALSVVQKAELSVVHSAGNSAG